MLVKVINDEWICARSECSHRMGDHMLRYEECLICADKSICRGFIIGRKEWEIIEKEIKQYNRRNSFIGRIRNKLGV